jgi:uncharacterized Tic20 family protein
MGDLGGNSYVAEVVVTEEERGWAIAAHLSTMAGTAVPCGNVLAPLVIWLIHREKSSFVSKHAWEAVFFQIGVLLAIIVLSLLAFASFGLGVLAICGIVTLLIADMVYMILAAIRAGERKIWEYPLTTRFVP